MHVRLVERPESCAQKKGEFIANDRESAPSSPDSPSASGTTFSDDSVGDMQKPQLSQIAKMLCGRLLLYSGENGFCNPSQETLAVENGIQPRQVRNALEELSAWGLITWQRLLPRRSRPKVLILLVCHQSDHWAIRDQEFELSDEGTFGSICVLR
jgi:hypothetical protein